jgi:hypothetical protein
MNAEEMTRLLRDMRILRQTLSNQCLSPEQARLVADIKAAAHQLVLATRYALAQEAK